MRYAIAAALLVLCGVVAVAANGTDKGAQRLVFKNAGFSIAPFDEPVTDSGRVLMMSMPASGGVTPNVSVLTQKHAGTLEEYAAQSKKQVEDLKLSIISSKIDKGVFFLEYAGMVQGHKVRCYNKAELASGLVYMAAGAAGEEQWKDLGPKLKACVDSFELTPSQPAPAAKSAVPAAK